MRKTNQIYTFFGNVTEAVKNFNAKENGINKVHSSEIEANELKFFERDSEMATRLVQKIKTE